MGAVAESVLENGGYVTGVSPYAMTVAGGELAGGEKAAMQQPVPRLWVESHPNREDVVADDMHTRKQLMALNATGGFVCLPGGYGTLEEVLEATTWVQLAIHVKPIIVLNVLNYYAPLRAQLVKAAEAGFINAPNIGFITFVDGPPDEAKHADYDWGSAVIEALENWKPVEWDGYGLDWTRKKDGNSSSQVHSFGSMYSRL